MLNVDEEHTNINELIDILQNEMSPAVEKEIMSLAEKLIEQGIERGEMELIKKMLANGVEPAFIAKNTGISIHKIKELQNKG